MLKLGWKRECCPQCRGLGRVMERRTEELKKSGHISKDTRLWAMKIDLGGSVGLADICDCCGVLYVYEVTK